MYIILWLYPVFTFQLASTGKLVLGSFLSRWKPLPYHSWYGKMPRTFFRTTFAEQIGPSILIQLGIQAWGYWGYCPETHMVPPKKGPTKWREQCSKPGVVAWYFGTGWSYIIGSPRSWVMTIPNIFQGIIPSKKSMLRQRQRLKASPFFWIPNGPKVGSNLVWWWTCLAVQSDHSVFIAVFFWVTGSSFCLAASSYRGEW